MDLSWSVVTVGVKIMGAGNPVNLQMGAWRMSKNLYSTGDSRDFNFISNFKLTTPPLIKQLNWKSQQKLYQLNPHWEYHIVLKL